MGTQATLTLILSSIFLIFGIIMAISDLRFKSVVILISMGLSGLFMVLTVKQLSYNEGQIDALKGKQKYQYQIHYEYIDSMYVPADTTIILCPTFEHSSFDKFFKIDEQLQSNYVVQPDHYNEWLRDRFIDAIMYRESRRNSDSYNVGENAAGILQIRPIMIKDVNRIVGYNKFTLNDRWNINKSIEIFTTYQDHYNPEWDFERGSRIWNGGPDGSDQNSTLTYWCAVKDLMPLNT